eukprot:TRINITY_DN23606_c3_g1_i1.p1 TRINITY_DN23606_c3_g1~~TRINITY_DN23606_c3_g1_i1.p1  ORF type:complete len:125 (+),score=8.43 TRINITY_DN23606_c3_g1_i1:293-667(+)
MVVFRPSSPSPLLLSACNVGCLPPSNLATDACSLLTHNHSHLFPLSRQLKAKLLDYLFLSNQHTTIVLLPLCPSFSSVSSSIIIRYKLHFLALHLFHCTAPSPSSHLLQSMVSTSHASTTSTHS